MKAKDMRRGGYYRLLKDGKVVVCLYRSLTAQYMIVHPPGEPDMQSSFGIPLHEEVEPLNGTAFLPT
jgi:hypothetical protein